MKTKLEAGATLDLLSKDELIEGVARGYQNWISEATRGVVQRRFSGQGTIAATNLSIGGAASPGRFGPEPGFVWSVRRLAAAGITLGTDSLAIYINDANPSSLVMPRAFDASAGAGARFFDGNQLILVGGDNLLFTGTGLNATGIVTITGMALELPVSLLYRLI